MKKIKSIFAIGFAALLGMGVAAGFSLANKGSAKEADAWSENTWYFIGGQSDWKWDDDFAFSLNSTLNRYETKVIELDGTEFKITLNKNWTDKEINCWDSGSDKPVDWDEWGNYVNWTSSGNFQMKNTGKKYKLYFTKADMNSYGIPGYAIHWEEYNVYKVSNGTSTITMNRISNDGATIQYEGVLDVTAGGSLSFLKDDAAFSTPTPQASAANNVFTDGTKKIIYSKSSAHVYLKNNSGTWSYYVTGRDHPYLIAIGATLHDLVPNTAAAEGNYMYTGLELAANATFKLYGDGYFAPSGAHFGQDDGLGFSSNGTQVTCTIAGTYNIYLDATQYDASLYIAGQSTADIKASALANEFLDVFDGNHEGGLCNPDGSQGAAYETALANAWDDLEDYYDANVKGNTDAENILKNADSSADTLYGRFAALYDKIYGDYSVKLELSNFAKRSVSSSGRVNFVPTLSSETNVTLIAIVASIVTVGAIAGYFLLKKKHA